jgi:cysteine synthase
MMKYVVIVFAVIAVICAGLFLWERNTVVKQAGQISALKVAETDLTNQVTAAKLDVINMKLTQQAQQQITDNEVGLSSQVSTMKETKCLEVTDEKTIADITDFFNNRGLLVGHSSGKTSTEVLPVSGKANTTKPSWTVKQITENYLTLIDYVLKLEKTVNCYEFP